MTIEQFYAEYFRRLNITRSKADANKLADAEQCAQTIDAMTGGAFFRRLAELPENYEWPTE